MKAKTTPKSKELEVVVARQAKRLLAIVKKIDKSRVKNIHLPLPVILTVLILVILAGGAFLLREQIVVAMVNGRPVFRYELNRRMTSAFGKETLENLIMEKLVSQEAKVKGVAVSESEIDVEVDKLSQSLGEGANIEEILKLQGMSMADLRYQIRIKLLIGKVLQGEVSVSDTEIDDFIKSNTENLTATDEAKRREEAKEVLLDQKVNEKFQVWMGEVFSKAKINRFLK
jgi:foldase protein PrsA